MFALFVTPIALVLANEIKFKVGEEKIGASELVVYLGELKYKLQNEPQPAQCAKFNTLLSNRFEPNKRSTVGSLVRNLGNLMAFTGNDDLASYMLDCVHHLRSNTVEDQSEIERLRDELDLERANSQADIEVIKAGLVRYELQLAKLKRELTSKEETLNRLRSGQTEDGQNLKSMCQDDLENSRAELARAVVRADSYVKALTTTQSKLQICEIDLRKNQENVEQCKRDLAASSTRARTGLAAAFQVPAASKCEAERARISAELSSVSGKLMEMVTKYNELLELSKKSSYVV